ncbi:hypothetical protein EV200_11161 [Pedobacter psychrotolerans]|uniref:Uncharacterized protein n=1 Tax=Pedobacter psychrotolerans TaxID=1843235 RepID=A0A4R2H3B3_9SPHI|nr:hypothetical protein EV200_11161 [Pedobacter psychrotolerans]
MPALSGIFYLNELGLKELRRINLNVFYLELF